MASGRLMAAEAGTIDIGGDLTVNRMGLGAAQLTGEGCWGNPPDRAEPKAALRRAVDLGMNFVDTADSYGPEVSELLIAEALYPYPEDLVIATKGGRVLVAPSRWESDGRPAHLRQACENSLRRLRLEQIPLYQLHRPDPGVPIAESLGALAELRDEGKIRHIGASNMSVAQFLEARRVTPIVSMQNRFNVSDRSWAPVMGLCERERLVFVPWAPLHGAGASHAVREIASRRGASIQQVALAWLLAVSKQALLIPGSGSAAHVADNAAAARLRLDLEEVAAITGTAPVS